MALEDEEHDNGEDDRGNYRIDDQRNLIAADALRLCQRTNQNRFRCDWREAPGEGTDFTDQRQHHGVVAGGLAQREGERCHDAESRDAAGTDRGNSGADQVDQEGSHDGVAAGELEELFAHQFQGTIADGYRAEEGNAQQHDEETGAEAFDCRGIRLADAGAEDGDGEDGDQTDVNFAEETDQDDRDQHDQGDECETFHGLNLQ